MRFRHGWVTLLLLYITLDFLDPSIPGVFFFDSEQLFIDAAVSQVKSPGPTVAVAQTTRLAGRAHEASEPQLPRHVIGASGERIKRILGSHAKYKDPSASPPSSLEDH